MLIDIKNFSAIADYDLVLCKPYDEPVMSLNRKIGDLNYKGTFLGTDEVHFTVPYYLSAEDKESNIKNPVWDEIKGEYLVRVKNLFISKDEYKVFVVKNVSESSDENGEIQKSVVLYSRENQLTDKKIVDYNGDSRLMYDPLNRVDDNGLEIGFLNHIFNRTSWKIGTVSSSLASKYRALSINNSTMLKAIQDAGKTFDCVFSFDTINKLINVHTLSEMGSNNDAYLSNRNFIKSLKKQIKNDEVKTRLYLYGKDKMSIQKINPLGQSYIDNFNYFKNTDYMTQDLIDALNSYDTFYNSKKGLFESAVDALSQIDAEIEPLMLALFEKETELTQLEDNADLYMVGDPNQYNIVKGQIQAKKNEIANVKSQIQAKEDAKAAQMVIIENLREDMAKEKHFTASQLNLLDSFVKEETYINNDYVEEQLQELLDFGVKTLNRISTPSVTFDIDVIDFLTLLEYQGEWKKFNLGDLVRIKNEELNFNILVRFVGYEHNYNDNSLKLKFTNKDSLEDSSFYLEEILSGLNSTASTVNWNRFDWAKGKDAQTSLEQYIENNLDLAKQKIISGDNQKTVIDERGIWLVKENPNGSTDPNQIRMVNNVIALTNDNWDNVEVAISPENGINANLIRGQLGEFARVNAGQINVGTEFEESPLGQRLSLTIEEKIGVPLGETRNIYELLMDKETPMTIHRGAYLPTYTNEPTASWITEGKQLEHVGDVFINTTTGKMYEYRVNNDVYTWNEITNQGIIDAVNQVKGEVNKVVLSKSEPPGSFLNGDLWIMPSGATFTYDSSVPSPYQWQLTSPTLIDLSESIVQDMRRKSINNGTINNTTSSHYLIMSTSSTGNLYLTSNFTNMTGVWKDGAMEELWMVYLKGYRNYYQTDTSYIYTQRTTNRTPSTSYGAYYNIITGEWNILNKDGDGNLIYQRFKDKVELNTEYNRVKITPQDGIIITDSSNRKMIQLGATSTTDYGLNVYNNTGTQKIVEVGKKGTQQGVWVNNNTGTNILKMGTTDNNYGFSVMDGSAERARLGQFLVGNVNMYGMEIKHENGDVTYLTKDGLVRKTTHLQDTGFTFKEYISGLEGFSFSNKIEVNGFPGRTNPGFIRWITVPPAMKGRRIHMFFILGSFINSYDGMRSGIEFLHYDDNMGRWIVGSPYRIIETKNVPISQIGVGILGDSNTWVDYSILMFTNN